MKIWKSNLQGFLEEAAVPVYMIAISERSTATVGSSSSMDMVTFAVCLTGFNEQNRPLALRIPRPAVPLVFQEDVERERQANLAVLEDLRNRLANLSREYRDGMVSDNPISGVLD
jgi:hypothetical protein